MAVDWKHDQPAVKYMRQLIDEYVSYVGIHHDVELTQASHYKKDVWNHPLKGVGGYVNRKTESASFSLHSEGRAADIYVAVKNPFLKKFGDELFSRLVTEFFGARVGRSDLEP